MIGERRGSGMTYFFQSTVTKFSMVMPDCPSPCHFLFECFLPPVLFLAAALPLLPAGENSQFASQLLVLLPQSVTGKGLPVIRDSTGGYPLEDCGKDFVIGSACMPEKGAWLF